MDYHCLFSSKRPPFSRPDGRGGGGGGGWATSPLGTEIDSRRSSGDDVVAFGCGRDSQRPGSTAASRSDIRKRQRRQRWHVWFCRSVFSVSSCIKYDSWSIPSVWKKHSKEVTKNPSRFFTNMAATFHQTVIMLKQCSGGVQLVLKTAQSSHLFCFTGEWNTHAALYWKDKT